MGEPARRNPDEGWGLVRSRRGEPTWEIALFHPEQGSWTESAYLAIDTNRPVELSDGCLDFLPLPMPYHQLIVQCLMGLLADHVRPRRLGEVIIGCLPVRLWPGKFRTPDVMFFRPGRIVDRYQPPNGADLVMEILSDDADHRQHDLVTKREEYARAGIPEYWIIDPEEKRIIVLTLDGQTYREHGDFGPGNKATSVLLPGFAVEVNAVLRAGQGG